MTTTTTVTALTVTDVIEAMRSIQTESDRWRLAESLKTLIPSGLRGFQELIDQANSQGVAGNLSVNTLRLYRDTATRWPEDKRVPNVSFSAHREAMSLPTIDAAVKMLDGLSKNLGSPAKVTVASVRKAIKVQNGTLNPVTSTAVRPTSSKASTIDVLADIKAGAPAIIAAVASTTTVTELDAIKAGLQKAIAHVERLQAKANRKNKAATAKPVVSTAAATPKKSTTTKSAGDLRDL
jgi:hypothetical protein